MICELLTECTGNIKTSGSFKCKNLKECVVCSDHRTKVKCEEKRKKYILENTQKKGPCRIFSAPFDVKLSDKPLTILRPFANT